MRSAGRWIRDLSGAASLCHVAARRCIGWGLLVVAISLWGCGSGQDRWKAQRPATVPARGQVTYRNEPLASAVVVFQPEGDEGFGASALTDENGQFDLKTFPPDPGAVPGTYGVTIIKMETPAGNSATNDFDRQQVIYQKSVIPEKYGNPAQSGLRIEIPQEGTDVLRFDLKN